MRKVKGLLTVIILVVILMGCLFAEQRYTRMVTVTEVKNGVVTVADDYEHEWEFFGEGFEEGQRIKVLMDNKTTDTNIFDDEIVRVID